MAVRFVPRAWECILLFSELESGPFFLSFAAMRFVDSVGFGNFETGPQFEKYPDTSCEHSPSGRNEDLVGFRPFGIDSRRLRQSLMC